MTLINTLLIFFIILNFILLLNFSKIKVFYYNIDKPDNIRKLHPKPTPLAGGKIIFLNIFIYWILLISSEDLLKQEIFFDNKKTLNYFMIISSLIFLLGFIDDKINIRANFKFGIYRNWLEHTWETGSDGGTTVVYFDEIRIGKTKDEVNSNLSQLGQQEYFYKKSTIELLDEEIKLIEEKITKLKKEVVENYDIEKSKKINDLKKKLRKLEYEKAKEK